MKKNYDINIRTLNKKPYLFIFNSIEFQIRSSFIHELNNRRTEIDSNNVSHS